MPPGLGLELGYQVLFLPRPRSSGMQSFQPPPGPPLMPLTFALCSGSGQCLAGHTAQGSCGLLLPGALGPCAAVIIPSSSLLSWEHILITSQCVIRESVLLSPGLWALCEQPSLCLLQVHIPHPTG